MKETEKGEGNKRYPEGRAYGFVEKAVNQSQKHLGSLQLHNLFAV